MILKQKQQKKSKKSYSILLMSMMCAAIVTIIAQGLAHGEKNFALSSGLSGERGSQSSYALAHINTLVDAQQSYIDDLLLQWGWGGIVSNDDQVWAEDISGVDKSRMITSPTTTISSSHSVAPEPILGSGSAYTSFSSLSERLALQSCTYPLPIDNTDPNVTHIVQWALDRCLITVSGVGKVYPYDFLTHEMMRIIADRAGFAVKMEFSSSKIVQRPELYQFMYTLQQHHAIGDLPVVALDERITRVQFLTLLYEMFDGRVHTLSARDSDLGSDRVLMTGSDVGSVVDMDETARVSPMIVSDSVVDEESSLTNALIKETLLWLVEKI